MSFRSDDSKATKRKEKREKKPIEIWREKQRPYKRFRGGNKRFLGFRSTLLSSTRTLSLSLFLLLVFFAISAAATTKGRRVRFSCCFVSFYIGWAGPSISFLSLSLFIVTFIGQMQLGRFLDSPFSACLTQPSGYNFVEEITETSSEWCTNASLDHCTRWNDSFFIFFLFWFWFDSLSDRGENWWHDPLILILHARPPFSN